MRILSEVGCVTKVTHETCESKIARSLPLCDRSCHVIYCPKLTWSSNSCQIQACEHKSESRSPLTSLPQFPNLLVVLGDRPSKVWKPWKVGQPFCAPNRKSIQHTFERHHPCRSSMLLCISVLTSAFLLVSFKNNSCFFPSRSCDWLVMLAENIQNFPDQKSDVGSSRSSLLFLQRCPHLRHVLLSLPS